MATKVQRPHRFQVWLLRRPPPPQLLGLVISPRTRSSYLGYERSHITQPSVLAALRHDTAPMPRRPRDAQTATSKPLNSLVGLRDRRYSPDGTTLSFTVTST